jgi:hypothetical protein
VDEVGLAVVEVDARRLDRAAAQQLGGGPVGDVPEAHEQPPLVGTAARDDGLDAAEDDGRAGSKRPGTSERTSTTTSPRMPCA